MKATFALYDDEGAKVDEETLRSDLPRAEKLLADLARAEGGIFIEDPDSKASAGVGDTLAVLIERFCRDGLDELVRDGHASIDFLDHEETLEISIDGDSVRYDSTRFGQRAFPREAYVTALRACGERFQALMTSLEGEIPEGASIPPVPAPGPGAQAG